MAWRCEAVWLTAVTMADTDLKVVCGNCELPIQERPEHERAPCPRCGSMTRNFRVEIGGELNLSGEVTASLNNFVDQSSLETANASATALTEIAYWVDQSTADTVNHVADGNIAASKALVPVGPYTDEQAKQIVITLRRVRTEAGEHAWARKKTYGGWIIGIVVALIAAAVALIKWST